MSCVPRMLSMTFITESGSVGITLSALIASGSGSISETYTRSVADKVMPTLPLSVMNVMDNMRGTQDMVVLGESSVSEASTDPLDYVVSGAQMLTINIK